MKTIVENNTKLSNYVFDDAEVVTLTEVNIVVGYPVKFSIAHLNASTATVYEGVTPPADWAGGKYTFEGTDWTLNPDWVELTIPEELIAE